MERQREYLQSCGVSKALDLLGERWTLLLVRELLLGPKRFGHLQAASRGLGPTLLSRRLKALVENGIAESARLPAPAAVQIYRLTARGEALRPTVESLAIWGYELVEPDRAVSHVDDARGSWLAFTAAATVAARGGGDGSDRGTAAVDVEGDAFAIRLSDGRAWVRHGVPDDPDVRVTSSMIGWWETLVHSVPPEHVEGDPRALQRVLRALALP